ncbi:MULTISPECIES: MFS transporter [unclassified Rhodococcus (in: high G+C Gram-positive bacteria)]|uniref:MFS transporter n=1 Tax=unclassified Rhodococcus (in: high G+C Gram-positive bacteria) TaxID=192944 RepID=UPI000A7A3572|nr:MULTISPECIES: MFS transporter [unclassified Rhodococcus (in: high G+C Gram-positive bacteria)]
MLAAGVVSFALMLSLVTPALPTIRDELGTSHAGVTRVLTAYLLSASIFTPIVGRLGDRYGKKRFLVIVLVALALGSLAAALATTLPFMILARVIQGIGGGVLPLAFGIIRDEFPPDEVGGAVGFIAALTASGAGLGLVLAGPILSTLNYRWLFVIPMVVVVAAAVAAQVFIPESAERASDSISVRAALAMSGWLVALLVAIDVAPQRGWTSVSVIGLLVVALVLCTLWILIETRSDSPLIDIRLMAARHVWATNLVALLFGVALYALMSTLPAFLQTATDHGYGFGASVTHSGLMLLPQSVFVFIAGSSVGGLARRFGYRAILVAGTIISFAALVTLAFVHTRQWHIFLVTSLTGVGFGLAIASMSSIVVRSVPRHRTGMASGVNANIRTIGGSLGASVVAGVVAANVDPSGVPAESGYTVGFLVLAGAMLLSVFAALAIPREPRAIA